MKFSFADTKYTIESAKDFRKSFKKLNFEQKTEVMSVLRWLANGEVLEARLKTTL